MLMYAEAAGKGSAVREGAMEAIGGIPTVLAALCTWP